MLESRCCVVDVRFRFIRHSRSANRRDNEVQPNAAGQPVQRNHQQQRHHVRLQRVRRERLFCIHSLPTKRSESVAYVLPVDRETLVRRLAPRNNLCELLNIRARNEHNACGTLTNRTDGVEFERRASQLVARHRLKRMIEELCCTDEVWCCEEMKLQNRQSLTEIFCNHWTYEGAKNGHEKLLVIFFSSRHR